MAGSSLTDDHLGDRSSLLSSSSPTHSEAEEAEPAPASPLAHDAAGGAGVFTIGSPPSPPGGKSITRRTSKASGLLSSVAALARGKSASSGYKELRSESVYFDNHPLDESHFSSPPSSSSTGHKQSSRESLSSYAREHHLHHTLSASLGEKLEAQYPESHMLGDILGPHDQGEDDFDIESHLDLSMDSSILSESSPYRCTPRFWYIYALIGAVLSLSASIAFFALQNFVAASFALFSMVYAAVFAGCNFVRHGDSTPAYFTPYHRRYTNLYMIISISGVAIGGLGLFLSALYAGINGEPIGPQSTWLGAVWGAITLKWATQCVHKVHTWSQERAIIKSMLL